MTERTLIDAKSDKRVMVKMSGVDIVFGDAPKRALSMMDEGKSRPEIQEATGQVLGVHNCTMDIHEGEVVVLMGLSGSGKSTLLRAINGLNTVIRGECLVSMSDDDTGPEAYANPAKSNARTLRKLRQERVAMVFQQFGLLPWRTVRENVGFGLEISGTPKDERAKAVDKQLELVGLSDWGDRRVQELSGGMQQRVGLARAFSTQAPILLMDEPFSALDPLIRDKLQDDLLDLQSRLKSTIVFVSHDLDEALKLGNRIAIMEGGRIIQFGTAQDIITNPATEYVAEFVAHMNPLSVLRANEVMVNRHDDAPTETTPISDAVELGQTAVAKPDTPLTEVMRAQVATGSTVFVEDDGAIVGRIDKDDVLKALIKQ